MNMAHRLLTVDSKHWSTKLENDANAKLLHACTVRHVPLAMSALREGARVSCQRPDSLTPLHIAAEHGDIQLMKLLCNQVGIDVEVKTMHGLTPLHTSILLGHVEATKILLDRGASVNAEDNLLRHPLHYAALQKDRETARLLIEARANVNVYDTFDETPLYTSVIRRPSISMMRLLLQHGAAATLAPRNETMGLLLEAVLSASESIGSSIKIVEYLLDHCPNINIRDPIGLRTPLHLTAITGNVPLTAYLVKRGGDLRARNLSGKTPLEVAFFYRNFPVAHLMEELLAELGGNHAPSTSGSASGKH